MSYLPECKTLRWPPQIKHVCQGIVYLSKSKMIPKIQTSAQNKTKRIVILISYF